MEKYFYQILSFALIIAFSCNSGSNNKNNTNNNNVEKNNVVKETQIEFSEFTDKWNNRTYKTIKI